MTLRRILATALVSSWLLAGVELASAQEVRADAVPAYQVAASEDDLLVLEVMIDRYRASQGVLAYLHEDDVFLPLGQLSNALELAVRVDIASRTASGWIIDQDRTFALDLNQNRVEFDQHVEGLPDASVYEGYDDFYVRSDVLSRWLPVDFEILLARMRLSVEGREALPLISRLERDRTRSKLLGNTRQDPIYPERRANYRGVAWPFVDTTLRTQGNNNLRSQSLTALGRADALGMNASGFVRTTRSTQDISHFDGWMNLERVDLDRNLLGPLHASKAVVGDIFAPNLPLVSPGRRGRGVSLTNRRLHHRRFDVTDVEGPANPGWEAELYVNGRLIAFQEVDDSGRYAFRDVPVYVGHNVMRVVLYGPEGQERERVHHFNSGSNLGLTGRLEYEAFVLQDGQSIFGSNLWGATTRSDGKWIQHFGLAYGLNPSLDVNLSFDRIPTESFTSDTVAMTVNKSSGRALWRLTYVDNLRSGQIGQLGVNSYLFGHNVVALASVSDAYETIERGSSEADRWQGDLRINGVRALPGVGPLSYDVGFNHRAVDDSDLAGITSYTVRANARTGALSLMHRAAVQNSTFDTRPSVVTLIGSQLVSGMVGKNRIRGSVHYRDADGFEFQSAGLTTMRALRPRLTTEVGFNHNFLDSELSRFDAQLSWSRDDVLCGLRVSADMGGRFSWALSLTTALAVQPDLDRWQLSGASVTRNGAAIARTFVDRDGDGHYGVDDEPLEGVSFRRNAKWKNTSTDADGVAWLTGIQPLRRVNVEIDMTSVFDPFLVPKYEGLATIVHRGGIADLEFPFVYVGDIEGTIFRDLLQQQPFSGVGLELLDPLGERVASAVSEFDGYYVFQRVPPGPYKIRIVETTLPNRDFIVPEGEPVVVPDRGDYVSGPVFILVREGERLDLKFASDGSLEGDVPEQLVPADSSEALIAGIRLLLSKSETPPTIGEIVADPALTDAERRTLRILHELFYEGESNYWFAR